MSIPRVLPADAHRLVQEEGYVYVDVRSAQEFEQSRPEGSWNVPLAQPGPGGMAPNPDFLAAMEKLFAHDARLVIGCQAGGRSARAAEMLAAAGFTTLVDQTAGMGGARDPFGRVVQPGWPAAGLPTASGPDPERGWAAVSARLRNG